MPHDAYEREADAVADRVMRAPRSSAARPVPAAASSPTHSLDPSTRAFFEDHFGHDFSGLRIHADAAAAHSARDLDALAYTQGRDIVFGEGRFAPGTREGQRLLAHELTHVVQQGGAAPLTRGADGRAPVALHRVATPVIQRQDAGPQEPPDAGVPESEPLDAGTPDPLDAGGPQDKQIECVERLGGKNIPGGIPTADDIAGYNERCRKETGYVGDDVLKPERIGTTRLDNVSSVRIDCGSGITFNAGTDSHTYRLTDCDLSEGTYDAWVSVDDKGVLQFDLGSDADAGVRFQFTYHVDADQTDPRLLFGGQDRVRIVATSSGKSVQEQLDEATGERVSAEAFGVTTRVTADHTLADTDDKTIVLRKGQISVTVTGTSVRFTFANGILITKHLTALPDPDIVIESISWNFKTQTLSTVTEQARIVSLVADPGQDVLDELEPILTKNLPMRMFEKGYNPFADKDLVGDLNYRLTQALILKSEGDGKKGPTLAESTVNASVKLKGALEVKNGPLALRAPDGLGVSFSVNGPMPESAKNAKVTSVGVEFRDPGINVDIDIGDGKITVLTVSGATLESGGRLKLKYVLTTEALEGMGKLALVLTGHASPTTLEDIEQKRLRAVVEAQIRKRVDPLIRDLIRQNRSALPGVDLATMLDVKAGE